MLQLGFQTMKIQSQLTKENETYFFDVKKIQFIKKTIEFSEIADVYLNIANNHITIQLLSTQPVEIFATGFGENKKSKLKSGEKIQFKL